MAAKKTGRKGPSRKRKRSRGRPAPRTARSLAGTRADAALVERTIVLLRAHDQQVAASKRQVGAHVLDQYFAGDEAQARSNDPQKPLNFTRLVARAEEETTWDLRDLREAVRIEITARRLPEQLAEALSPSLLLRMSSLDDTETQREIAARIVNEPLGEAEARELIAKQAGDVRHGGRPRQPGAVRVVSSLDRVLERAESDEAFAPASLRNLSDSATRASLARRLADIGARLFAWAERLRGS